ncbi:23943_t:CDS:1, partial [Gigaspora rosea]
DQALPGIQNTTRTGAAHENINKDRKEIINMASQQSVEAGEVHDAYQKPNTQKRRKQNTNDITSELLNTTTQENSKSCESTSAMLVEPNSRSGLTPKIPSMMSETTTEINNTQIRIDPIQQDREADKISKQQSQSNKIGTGQHMIQKQAEIQ